MNIAIPKLGTGYHLLTNQGLKVGDKVYPMAYGYTEGTKFYVTDIDTSAACSGWPNHPHTILDLNYSTDKAYQVHTDHGFSPIECYFKIIEDPKG